MSNSQKKIYIELDSYAPTLKRLQKISKLLDNAITIPGTSVGIGLDPILGLIPVVGDILGLIFSLYIIIESAKLGISKATLVRMVFNIIVDALVGSIPLLGDLFDFAWTANNYNLILLEDYLKSPDKKKKADQGFIITLFVVLVLIAIVLIALPVIFIGIILKIFNGV
jgi:hypothetical protein